MPSSSKKQHRFMQAVSHNPEFAKKAGVPQSVGKDFESADKAAGKYQKGKSMANESINQFIGLVASGNKEEANAVFQDAIMDKVAARLEGLRADVAREYFNFKESKGDNEIDNSATPPKGQPSNGQDNDQDDEQDDQGSDNDQDDNQNDGQDDEQDNGKDNSKDDSKKAAVLNKLRAGKGE